jgi:putative transposase
MAHSKGCHTTYHHRYHIVWAPKYRFKVLRGEVRLRVREIIRQVCSELGVTIINGVLSSDHVQRFWGRGFFSTTSGNITDDVIMNYLDKHTERYEKGFSPSQ